jgi:hypothetical protein
MAFPFLPPAGPAGMGPASSPASSPFSYRGLYVEGTWGPDLMSLDDWRQLVDELAALGLNSLGIGIYGCWGVQYDGKRTEFLMVPFPEHPALRTPQTVRWHSPAAGKEMALSYLPRMFEGDFFGQVVAYGRERGVAVRPHFNGPGHTTLIPAVYPEVSAKDEAGQPTGFGYCLSSSRTDALLFSLYDSLIERHLRPNGGEWWHLGLDEVEPTAGVDEADPAREVDPWCRCPDCAGRSPTQLLVDFAVRSIEHLAGQGIRHVTLWHDALVKLEALAPLRAALAARGLAERVVVQWWHYDDPPLVVGRPGLRSWVTPMAGAWPNLFHHDSGPNIKAMAAAGVAAGSEGLDAYCIFDPAAFRTYALLATLGRRPDTTVDAFRAAFAAWLFEGTGQGEPVPAAFGHFDRLFDAASGPLGTLLDALLHHGWTSPAHRHVRYPRDQIAQLAADPLRLGRALATVQVQAQALYQVCAAAAPRGADDRRRRLLAEYAAEAHKLAGIVAASRQAAVAWRHHRQAQRAPTRFEAVTALTRAQAALQSARQAVHQVMAELERVKAPFLHPLVLRELTPLYRWCAGAHDRVRDWRERVEAGGLDDVPDL